MKKLFIVVGSFILIVLTQSVTSFSEENSANSFQDFTYEIVMPTNQINRDVGYYDLLVSPGQNQTIQLKIHNVTAKDIAIAIRRNSAKTNNSGVIEYGPNKIEKDPSLKVDFPDIVKGPEKVMVPSASTKTVDFLIEVPSFAFEGYISGGIQLQKVEEDKDESNEERDGIVNEFAYLVGMLISETETKNIKPKMKLNKVYPGIQDGKAMLFVNFSNSQPVYGEDLSVHVKVRNRNKTKILFEIFNKNMRIAPNSMLDFPVPIDDKRMKAGEYTAEITVKTQGNKTWSWVEDFMISNQEAKGVNSQVIEARDRSNGSRFLMIIAPIVVLMIIYKKIVKRKNKKSK
ncbi:hypothetical protein IGL98_002699 [Enterococcus sp. DIV0840]|uniref:DUF916 and DUF3324 domain-containing protein n=1 Tax=Enterococcus TaxID=1350 RepID=UPI001A8DAEE4|nr:MULTISPECIES: DUF916 and DUF3324 domain-containing protein [Enterococcus]MBO0433037.1 DUF916 and DUF3324 domain-containing protein [Enterococcus sp. DIV0849a]MBO0473076.1 DUF916 and DUF3324 domain-containing protein [Enterococcus ureasiticus]